LLLIALQIDEFSVMSTTVSEITAKLRPRQVLPEMSTCSICVTGSTFSLTLIDMVSTKFYCQLQIVLCIHHCSGRENYCLCWCDL